VALREQSAIRGRSHDHNEFFVGSVAPRESEFHWIHAIKRGGTGPFGMEISRIVSAGYATHIGHSSTINILPNLLLQGKSKWENCSSLDRMMSLC
jgi:hypothetical protein